LSTSTSVQINFIIIIFYFIFRFCTITNRLQLYAKCLGYLFIRWWPCFQDQCLQGLLLNLFDILLSEHVTFLWIMASTVVLKWCNIETLYHDLFMFRYWEI